MSRIGKKPIVIPDGVQAKIEGEEILIKGPKGELRKKINPEIKVVIKDKEILVLSAKMTKKTNALWGLARALIFNMVRGVKEGYEKKLQIEGIGFKAKVEGEKLVLNVGFSHPIEIKQPSGIKFSVEKNFINVSGINKELVGQVAANIRAVKPPEPYKGKGIRYVGEKIKIKAGKKVVATGT